MSNKSHKSFFMPMLCRFSQNDTVKPTKLNNSSATDPSSPKLTCIGQIKKRSTTTTTTTTTKNHHHHSNRYTKLHKLFSGKNLFSPGLDKSSINKLKSKSVAYRSKSCNDRNRIPINKKKYFIDDQDIAKAVLDKELDPPLPVVVKCHRQDQESNMNLWKRRGIEVKSLQIQPIQLNLNQNTRNNNRGFSLSTSAATF